MTSRISHGTPAHTMVVKSEKELLAHFGANTDHVKQLCTVKLDLDPLCSLIAKIMAEVGAQTTT
jgi:hypothetical protein